MQHPKHRQVYEALADQITTGRVGPGDRLPSEADLGRRFGASRITVGRALRDLQVAGLVERRAGSGTYVRAPRHAAGPGLAFGVLMPEMGEVEVFDAICRGLAESPQAGRHLIVWAGRPPGLSKADAARRLAERYIERQVDGVFFAPIELTADKDAVNREIADRLAAARIPVVLVDRAIEPYPRRGRHDLVSLDNRRAGAQVADHLLSLGSRRPAFLGLPASASSVDARLAGFLEAARAHGLPAADMAVWRADPADSDTLASLLARDAPDAVVCASDRTAAVLLQTLAALGRRVPDDLRVAGIDDVAYAGLLRVPLTSVRQPCAEIGAAAFGAMLERVARPDLPPREILLHGTLVVRDSSGASR